MTGNIFACLAPQPKFLPNPSELTAEQARQLRDLYNRATLYEAVIIRSDGQKCLLCDTAQKSRRGLMAVAAETARWKALWTFCGLPDDGSVLNDTGQRLRTSNGCSIAFSGRTKRDVIIDGTPLVYVVKAAAALKQQPQQ